MEQMDGCRKAQIETQEKVRLMPKLPYISFYPGDWLRDHIAGCSLAAQGLWLRMMILMHDCERYGHLAMNGSPIPSESIARRCGCTLAQYETLLAELTAHGVPGVSQDGTIFSRRMVRDAQKRAGAAQRQSRFRNAASNAPVTPIEDEVGLKLRLGKLFRRKAVTPWNWKEEAAFKALLPIDDEELQAVERYYSETIPKEKDYRRRDLQTLLNNWSGEVDRARGRMPAKRDSNGSVRPQPEGWEAWRKEHYPESRERDFWRVPDDVKEEFRKAIGQ
jgi:hypothetical protein